MKQRSRRRLRAVVLAAASTAAFGALAWSAPAAQAGAAVPQQAPATSTSSATRSLATHYDASAKDDVYTVAWDAQGASVSIHDPADGVSAAQLRSTLTKAGQQVLPAGTVPDRATPSSTLLSGSKAAACPSYGTAHAWCGHVWSYGAFNDPQVYFLDHTPAGFPVTNAVADWYQSPGIDAYYRWYTQGCPSGRHCVSVSTYTAPAGEFGVTTWAPGTQTAKVQLSSTLPRNARQARKTTCHELGHALGLDHNSSTNSCLKQGAVGASWSLKPSSQDFKVLTLIYPKPGS